MADASDDRRIGSVIAGYRIDSRIGRGGMGVVYRAHHLSLERQAALKVIAPDLAESSGFRERFSREARVAAALDAPEHRHRLRRGRGRRHAVSGDAVHRGLGPRADPHHRRPPEALPGDRRLPPGRRRARRRTRAGPDPPRRQAGQRADRGPQRVPDRLRADQAPRGGDAQVTMRRRRRRARSTTSRPSRSRARGHARAATSTRSAACSSTA